jgi:dolichyl-phosphate-mannose-protein mannosyltransferase
VTRQRKGTTSGAPSAAALERTDATIRLIALGSIAIYGLYWLYQALTIHRLGNYGVETDFYWKYGPAAAALKQGRVLIEHFDSKGWGYPLVVAAISFLGLDLFRAGQVVAVLSACAVLASLFLLLRRPLGSVLALFGILVVIANPTFLANVYEVGTDMFFFALVAGSIALLLGVERPARPALLASGALAGWAFTTRYNGLFLWPGAVIALVAMCGAEQPVRARWARAGLWSAAFLLLAAPWLLVNAAHTGNPLTNDNYTDVGFSVYGEGNWERFFYGERKVHSLADVVLLDPARFARAMASNTVDHLKRDLTELNPMPWNLLSFLGLLVIAIQKRGRFWSPFLLLGLLYFLTLVPVFYGARFSLPMLAFYAALAVAPFAWDRVAAWTAPIERRFPIRIFVFLLMWMPGALAAFANTQDPRNPEAIQTGPYETIEAAEYLKAHGAGATLLARKPHVAFLAGMTFAPIPQVDSPAALHEAAIHSHARYVLVSGAEMALRAGVRPLAEDGANVPGFRCVFESPGALVYEVLPDSAGSVPARGTSPPAPAAP